MENAFVIALYRYTVGIFHCQLTACFFACLFCKIILQNEDIVVPLHCQKIRVKPAALVGKFCSP